MEIYDINDVKIVKVNNSSVKVMYNGEEFFVTHQLFNRWLREEVIEGGIIYKTSSDGISSKWLAILSIF